MGLREVILNRVPESRYELTLREQSIGEARGLGRLKFITDHELIELREQVEDLDKK